MGLGQFQGFGQRAGTAQSSIGPGLIETLGTIGGFATGNPFLGAIAGQLGAGIFNKLFAQESPFASAIEQQLQASQQLIPQLQAQARGESSVASRNIQQQLRQQTTSAQQSFAAGATARGGGGTPVAAQQARFRQAETVALGNVLAQLQQSSQAALLGIGQSGLQGQNLLEIERARNNAKFADQLSSWFGERAARKELDPRLKALEARIDKMALGALNLPSVGGADIAGQFVDPTAGRLFR